MIAPVATASKSQFTEIEETGRLLSDNPTIRAGALDEMQSLGAGSVKIPVTWRSYAPDGTSSTKPSVDLTVSDNYPAGVWAGLDEVIAGAQARGMKVWLMITAPAPRWAVRKETAPAVGSYEPDPADYAEFVQAVGSRYANVHQFSLWNEVNLKRFMQPQTKSGVTESAIHYRDMYRAAYKALGASGHASDTILMGEILARYQADAPDLATRPIKWLREFFCIDAKGAAYRGSLAAKHKCTGFKAFKGSGLAYHPYNLSGTPTQTEKTSPDNAPINYFPRVYKVLDQAYKAKHLATKKMKIYNSEYGIQMRTSGSTRGQPLSKVPYYLNVSEYLNWVDPRVASFSQYLLTDNDPSDTTSITFQTGLRSFDGIAKPGVYEAFQTPMMAFKTSSSSKVSIWGCLRAKPAGTSAAEVQVKSGNSWDTVATIPVSTSNGYFQQNVSVSGASSKTFRVSWSGGVSRSSKPIALIKAHTN